LATIAAMLPLVSCGAAKVHRRSVNPVAAALQCAAGKSIRAPLGAGDVRYISGLLSCVVRVERAQLGLSYRQSPVVSQGVFVALGDFVRSSDLFGTTASHTVYQSVMRDTAAAACAHIGARDRSSVYDVEDSRPPPVLTPRHIASILARSFSELNPVMSNPSATVGVAARAGVLFERDDLNGVAWGFMALVCR
jgi:hypothetical protein